MSSNKKNAAMEATLRAYHEGVKACLRYIAGGVPLVCDRVGPLRRAMRENGTDLEDMLPLVRQWDAMHGWCGVM